MAEVTAEDLKFPKSVIARIIKDVLPEGAKISKEAQCAIARSAAIFILHATSMASDHAQSKRRKNMTAEDILHAIRQLDCAELEEPIIEGLEVYKNKKTDQIQRRQELKVKRKESEKFNDNQRGTAENGEEDDELVEVSDYNDEEEEEEHSAKEATMNGNVVEEDENDDVVEISDDDID